MAFNFFSSPNAPSQVAASKALGITSNLPTAPGGQAAGGIYQLPSATFGSGFAPSTGMAATNPFTNNTGSAVGATSNTTQPAGWGAPNAGAATPGLTKPAALGFKANFGVNNTTLAGTTTTTGFPNVTGTSFGGTGLSSMDKGLNPVAQQYVYKGIKGPGYAPVWQSTVDFSQINDNTLFESLPVNLQQHLIELYTFIRKEEDALKAVYNYLNDVAPPGGTTAPTDSYRRLSHLVAKLKGGHYSIDTVAVCCEHRDKEVQSFSKLLDVFESSIREYQKRVWEPLLASGGDLTRAKDSSLGGRQVPPCTSASHAHATQRTTDPKSPLFSLVEELLVLMQKMGNQLEELEMDVMLPLRLRGWVNNTSSTNQDSLARRYTNTTVLQRHANSSSCCVASSQGKADRFGSVQLSTTAAAPVNGAAGAVVALTTVPRASGTPQIVSHINAAMANLSTTLINLSCWADHQHKRSDDVRSFVARQYGPYEAEVLFSPPLSSQDTTHALDH